MPHSTLLKSLRADIYEQLISHARDARLDYTPGQGVTGLVQAERQWRSICAAVLRVVGNRVTDVLR